MLRVYRLLFLCASIACVVSLPAPEGRIVGGFNAMMGQFAHQVSLQREDGAHTCGGSILNERYILTAAHCVVVGKGIEAYPPRYFQVRVGSIQRSAGGKVLQLKRIIVNKNYKNTLNDVALLETEEPMEWTLYVRPIELANEEVPSGSKVVVSGWGRIETNGAVPHRMKWNVLQALNTEECQKRIKMGHDSIICLDHTAGNGVCNGDSGGPATYQDKLVGVAGFVVSAGCGTDAADGYAKVFYHRNWILENMKN